MAVFAKVFTVCQYEVAVANRTLISIPDEVINLEEYPTDLFDDLDQGYWISEEEWIELKKIHNGTTKVSDVVSMEELDIVFGKEVSSFPEMKEKIVEYWTTLEEEGSDRPDQLRNALDCTNWNGPDIQF